MYIFLFQLDCINETNQIILHSRDLSILEPQVTLVTTDGNEIAINKHSYNLEYEFYIITLSKSLTNGEQYVLTIPFIGDLKPGLAGFYRSSYTDTDDNEK